MTTAPARTGIWTNFNILNKLDFESGCEHQHHDLDKRRHQGPAAWLQTGTCPSCGDTLTILVCDAWRQTVSSWALGKHTASCPTCFGSVDPVANLGFIRI